MLLMIYSNKIFVSTSWLAFMQLKHSNHEDKTISKLCWFGSLFANGDSSTREVGDYESSLLKFCRDFHLSVVAFLFTFSVRSQMFSVPALPEKGENPFGFSSKFTALTISLLISGSALLLSEKNPRLLNQFFFLWNISWRLTNLFIG